MTTAAAIPLTKLEAGSAAVVLRNGDQPFRIRISRACWSYDGGKTWQVPADAFMPRSGTWFSNN